MARKLRAFDRRGFVAAYDHAKTGSEPTWEDATKWDIKKFQKERARALGFYNYYLKKNEMYQFLFDWMEQNGYTKSEIAAVKAAPHIKQTPCKIARCLSMGMPNRQDEMQKLYDQPDNGFTGDALDDVAYVKDTVIKAIKAGKQALKEKRQSNKEENEPTEKEIAAKKENLEAKEHEKIIDCVFYPLEEMIDKWSDTKTPQKMGVESLLNTVKVKPEVLADVHQWLTDHIEEYELAVSKKDKLFSEGYIDYTPKKLRRMIKLLKEMREEVDSYVEKSKSKAAKKKLKKVRQRKPKSPVTLVKKVKFCESHENWKGLQPIDVIGKRSVVTYNHKRNQLALYRSDEPDGLTFKGTTLRGFNEDESIVIRIKPEQVDDIVKRRTLDTMKKNLSNRKPKPAKGRFDDNTLILKIL